MENKELNTEEKINYIYETLKKQEKREFYKNIIKWVFRWFIIIYMLYFYFFWYKILINSVKDSLSVNINTESIFDWIKNKLNLENNNY
jgi:ABC-type phosphate transport system permease subunit